MTPNRVLDAPKKRRRHAKRCTDNRRVTEESTINDMTDLFLAVLTAKGRPADRREVEAVVRFMVHRGDQNAP